MSKENIFAWRGELKNKFQAVLGGTSGLFQSYRKDPASAKAAVKEFMASTNINERFISFRDKGEALLASFFPSID